MESDCFIDDLLVKSFGSRPFQEKLELVRKGRPVPKLPNLCSSYKDKNRSYTRHFSDSNYERTVWLTGSVNLNKLFCFPCLLFSSEKTVWSTTGFCDLNNLCKAIGKHEKTKSHITSFFKLQTFGDSNSRIDLQLDHQKQLEVAKHNENVLKNRRILSSLINAVCFLAKQELPFRGHCESRDSDNKGNYIELLNYTAEFDSQLEEHLKTSTIFRGTSPQIQNDIITAISSIIHDFICEEIKKSHFISVLVDETSDIANKSQLSICIRYVDKVGDIQERFLKFVDVSANKSADALFEVVNKTIIDYDGINKIVGQTYDGAPVMSGGVRGLQAKIKEKFPEALFVHCYSHVLNLVLQQSVSHIKECNSFFTSLCGIGSFFSKSPKRANSLSDFMSRKLPKIAPTRWNFSSRLVNTVKENRQALIEFFESIINNSDEWDSESILLARGCASFLESFKTCFLIDLFSSIFSHTDVLFDILQNKTNDLIYCCKKIEDVKSMLNEKRENMFPEFWKNILETSTEQPRKRRNEDPELFFKSLFHEILDTLIVQITDRFGNYKDLEFTALLDVEKFAEMNHQFPESAFRSVLKTYSKHFDSIRLRNELLVLYWASESDIKKPLHLMLKYMVDKKLNLVMPEIFKLLLLILTLPATTATVERSFSTLKRIKSFTRSAQGQERLNGLALIAIEKRVLKKLRQDPKYKFEEKVIEKFCLQTRRMEFMFK